MPSFGLYKKMLDSQTDGQSRKIQSDVIMEASWYEDISSKEAYIFDFYHDEEPLKYYNFHPENWKHKTKVDIKFLINSYNSEAKDIVGKNIMFKPSFRWQNEQSLSYYQDSFVDKYEAEFPIGMFCAIQDEKGVYRKWLVTEIANALDLQFPTWYILPCDHVFQWVYKDKLYQMCGVSRSQNSYNSGEWTDHITTGVENQRKCILPMNSISTTIFYNQRIILSAPIETPIVWHCSKVEQTSPKGINRLTFAQEEWDEHKDVFEYADGSFTSTYYPDKKIVGMWADYNSSSVIPTLPSSPTPQYTITTQITYSGVKPEIKVGGNYKKFTVTYYKDKEETVYSPGVWKFEIDGKETDLVALLTCEESSDVGENQIKVKFTGDGTYIGKLLTVKFVSDFAPVSSVDVEIKSL